MTTETTPQGDHEKCNWCSEVVSLNDLTGWNSQQCPHCGNPMMKAEFGQASEGIVFCCSNGGKWAKFSATHAVCTEEDSSFYVGEHQEFEPAAIIYPF